MTLLIAIFTVLAGLAFGSFLNVCISRLPRHESIVTPRSRCPQCLTPILGRDNIPLLSWLVLRGRCRSCGVAIAVRYPLIEAATAALFLLCLLEFGLTLQGVGAAALCWFLLGLAATDAETMLLPDTLTLPGIALGIAYPAFPGADHAFSWHLAAQSLFWAVCAATLIVLIRGLYWVVRRREGMGLGDAKLLALIAAWLGPWQTALVFLLATVAAAVYGLTLITLAKVRSKGDDVPTLRLPLGSFLGAAAIFAAFEGEGIVRWYFSFFS